MNELESALIPHPHFRTDTDSMIYHSVDANDQRTMNEKYHRLPPASPNVFTAKGCAMVKKRKIFHLSSWTQKVAAINFATHIHC